MARLFDDGNSEYAYIDSNVGISGTPFSMACWYNIDAYPSNHVLMTLVDKSADNERHLLYIASTPRLFAFSQDAGGLGQANSTNDPTLNTWEHACGVWVNSTSRKCYIDGGSVGSDNTDVTPSGLDRFAIGAHAGSTPGLYVSGSIAEAAVWNIELLAADVLMLSKGYAPLFVKPASLVAYWPLIRNR